MFGAQITKVQAFVEERTFYPKRADYLRTSEIDLVLKSRTGNAHPVARNKAAVRLLQQDRFEKAGGKDSSLRPFGLFVRA